MHDVQFLTCGSTRPWEIQIKVWECMMGTAITNEEIVQRLVELERRLDELSRVVRVQKPQPGWLHGFYGMFADEPAFEEVIELGRRFRNADRPSGDDEPTQ